MIESINSQNETVDSNWNGANLYCEKQEEISKTKSKYFSENNDVLLGGIVLSSSSPARRYEVEAFLHIANLHRYNSRSKRKQSHSKVAPVSGCDLQSAIDRSEVIENCRSDTKKEESN